MLKCDAHAIVAHDGHTTISDVSGDPRAPKNHLKNLIEIDSSVFKGFLELREPQSSVRGLSRYVLKTRCKTMVAPGWQWDTIVLVTGSLKNKLPDMFVVTYSPFFQRFREHPAPRKSEVIDF